MFLIDFSWIFVQNLVIFLVYLACSLVAAATDVDGIVDGWPPVSLSKLGPWALDPGFGAPERALERRGAAATPPMGVSVGVECC